MIYTLTPNPSVDRSITIPEIRFNSVLRSQSVRLDWAGKGFNVSRALQILGIESIALGWVGGGTGKMLEDGLKQLGIQTDFVWVTEDTRTNTMINEAAGEWHMKINEPGPSILTEDIDKLIDKIQKYVKKDDLWVLSGSLPPDVPDDFYAKLIQLLKKRKAKVFLDASEKALTYGIQASPYMVKPNLAETTEEVGFSINNIEDAKRAALHFLRAGIDFYALTMGASGLLLASQKEMVYALPPKIHARNTAGSGDALLAAMIHAQMQGFNLIEVARWGVAVGSASIETEGVSEFEIDRVYDLLKKVDSRVINVL